jgi:ureidoacrylate peracid hydrolase
VSAAQGDGLAGWIDPKRTALLIVDMQVDFALPEGAMGRAGLDLSAAPEALAQAERLAAAARARGVPVVFAALRTSADSDPPASAERLRRRGEDPIAGLAVCRAGTRGADLVGPTPLDGELVIAKPRYSAFVATDLDAALKARAVDTLVVCGLTTECCVDCTVRDAFHLDYSVFLVADACAAYAPDLHEAALRILDLNCAIVVRAAEVLDAWR